MDPLYNLLITPIYLCVIYFLIAPYFAKKWTNKYTRKYFWWGLHAKMIGSIAFCIIYQFYYGGGDTIEYFKQGGIIVDAFFDSPNIGYETLMYNGSNIKGENARYLGMLYMKKNNSTWLMVQISSIVQFFSLKTFYPTSLLFGLWSFLGSWKLAQLFCSIYKENYKLICFSILFIPSCLFWSSGIMKETVTTGAIGFFVFYFCNVAFKRKDLFLSLIFLILLFTLIKVVKGATIYVLLPCLALWLFLFYFNKIPLLVKYIFSFILISTIPLVLLLMIPKIQEYIENNDEFVEAQKTINGFQSDHGGAWRKGRGHGGGDTSAYHLSTAGDLSLLGMLKSMPEAISFTLFRPFPWEAKKAVQLMGAGESILFLILTIYVLLKVGLIKTVKQTFTDPHLGFVLSYALFFGFIAGYISFNYGVLQRFKTPMMPFYTLFLVIHYQYIVKTKRKKLFKKR
ncbi:hypothetical protein [Flammeovirga agarivorans]|uniref:Glycosyltransferase RgtA/B/C/D-like domain-containing protein n=1 Tax=Flammeovirga agarivorans TaxID=2726742 RepID=A0A7X8SLS3_9BACT|nr:hypothetical protein [Flammeovirga agarivorans]NLR92498.1 hypothetical protein [Flammeovirga agarivorans]